MAHIGQYGLFGHFEADGVRRYARAIQRIDDEAKKGLISERLAR